MKPAIPLSYPHTTLSILWSIPMRAHLLLAPVLSATALLVGCEWTSSDGITWDESYNNVNFSGTYNLGNGLADSSGQNVSKTRDESTKVKTSGGTVKSKTYSQGHSSGTIGGGVVPGSVSVVSKGHVKKTYEASFADDGNGVLVGGTDGNGTINYNTGAWSIPATWVETRGKNDGDIESTSSKGPVITETIVRWQTETVSVTNTTPGYTNIVVQYVSVQQSGQNLTMTFSNGYTFSGKISGYNTDSDSIEHASSVIAKFNVSGANGKIVGTLNSLATSRQLDGVWTKGGSSNAIVGSAIGSGRTISENTEAIEAE